MRFDEKHLKITVVDHMKKSTTYVTIDGRCMNFYYCQKTLDVCINLDSLDKIIGSIGKTNNNITFILKQNYRSTLYIIIKDFEYNIDNTYEVEVNCRAEEIPYITNDDTNYPIKFRTSSKHFKSLINNVHKLSDTFTIQKNGDSPLQFTFDKAHKVNWIGTYRDHEKISLQSKIVPGDIFSISFEIDYIKPFSNSTIGDIVVVAADKREKISFTTYLDPKPIGNEMINTCEIKVFTEIKNYTTD